MLRLGQRHACFDNHRAARRVDVTFEISEGARAYVERIDISGNVRTLDEVIKTYPKSEAAEAARERLPTVKG